MYVLWIASDISVPIPRSVIYTPVMCHESIVWHPSSLDRHTSPNRVNVYRCHHHVSQTLSTKSKNRSVSHNSYPIIDTSCLALRALRIYIESNWKFLFCKRSISYKWNDGQSIGFTNYVKVVAKRVNFLFWWFCRLKQRLILIFCATPSATHTHLKFRRSNVAPPHEYRWPGTENDVIITSASCVRFFFHTSNSHNSQQITKRFAASQVPSDMLQEL